MPRRFANSKGVRFYYNRSFATLSDYFGDRVAVRQK
jgi:hypothetical protein